MSGAAGQDEGHEQGRNPTVRGLQVAALANEPGQGERDREIGQADDGVGTGVQRDQARRPAQTETVGSQSRRVQQPIPKCHGRAS